MPTHGRSLSSGSIDALTLKDDGACLDQRRGGTKCVGVGLEHMGVQVQMLSSICVFLSI